MCRRVSRRLIARIADTDTRSGRRKYAYLLSEDKILLRRIPGGGDDKGKTLFFSCYPTETANGVACLQHFHDTLSS